MDKLRRTQILEAAIRVFAARGFHRATVRDVAREAGVADGTIYNHFENKTALLLGILDPLDEASVPNSVAPTDVSDLRRFFRESFQRRWSAFRPETIDALKVVLSEALVNPEVRRLYLERVIAPTFAAAEPLFEQLAAAGRLRAVDVPLTLRAMTATFLGLVLLRSMDDPQTRDRWDEIPDFLTDLFLKGVLLDESERGGL